MFCDRCGSMLKKKNGDMICTECGQEGTIDDNMVSTREQDDSDVIETEEGASFEGKPTDDSVNCDDCGHNIAYYTIKQTGSADEPPTRFFKCAECGNRWRDYN